MGKAVFPALSSKVNKRRTVRNKENHYLVAQKCRQIQRLTQICLPFDILSFGLLHSRLPLFNLPTFSSWTAVPKSASHNLTLPLQLPSGAPPLQADHISTPVPGIHCPPKCSLLQQLTSHCPPNSLLPSNSSTSPTDCEMPLFPPLCTWLPSSRLPALLFNSQLFLRTHCQVLPPP